MKDITQPKSTINVDTFENLHIKSENRALKAELAAIQSSRGWKLLNRFRGFVHKFPIIKRAYNATFKRLYTLLGVARSAKMTPKDEVISDAKIVASTFVHHGITKGRAQLRSTMVRYMINISPDLGYKRWIDEVESKIIKPQAILEELKTLKQEIKFSILMPVYNVNPELLRKTISTVQTQLYENWELCIHNDGSTKYAEEIINLLTELSDKDSRIKFSTSEKNGHISHATNEAAKLATGQFIVLMDNDDEIPPYALYYVAKALIRNPKLKFIYSDENLITEKGDRRSPVFKPDWAHDTTLSMMYTTHLGVYEHELYKEVGMMRVGYEGSQDYDLVLRITEKLTNDEILHIPLVLYHWKMVDGSTSISYDSKPYARAASIKALNDAITRRKLDATVEDGMLPALFRVRYKIKGNPLISIIIPARNMKAITKRCVDSILNKTVYQNYEILLVDNNSDESDTKAYFDSFNGHEKVRVLRYKEAFNYSAINNFAVKEAQGEHIVLLNNDTEVINAEWLESMLEFSQQDQIGAVGAKLLYPNNLVQHAGVVTGIVGIAGHVHRHADDRYPGYLARLITVQNVSAVTGACLMVKKSLYEAVGGLDEVNLKIALNDVDFCLKLLDKGLRNIYTPYARLYHHESASRGLDDLDSAKKERFMIESSNLIARWGDKIADDCFYSPNLSILTESVDYADDASRTLNRVNKIL